MYTNYDKLEHDWENESTHPFQKLKLAKYYISILLFSIKHNATPINKTYEYLLM